MPVWEVRNIRVHLVIGIGLLALALLPAAVGDTCAPTCDVVSAGRLGLRLVFVPAATVVESGSTLTWSAVDPEPHTATDKSFSCFHAPFDSGRPGSVQFHVIAGALWTVVGEAVTECEGASALPDGSFSVSYSCIYHPEMQADLVIH